MKSSDPNWKGCSPRVTRIAIVDDDEEARNTLVELVQGEYPKLTVRGFASIYECYQGVTTYQYILIDVSSLAPQMMRDIQSAWGPISKYASEYPATEFVITSAASRNCLLDIVDDCVEQGKVERRRLHIAGFLWDRCPGGAGCIKDKLNELIKPEDCEWTKVKSKLKK